MRKWSRSNYKLFLNRKSIQGIQVGPMDPVLSTVKIGTVVSVGLIGPVRLILPIEMLSI